jgi:rhamnulose-1-phosphate aldolase/alcohol dehydrogenase
MQSRWSDEDARACVNAYPQVSEDLALRVYTSRLIGSDPDLVLHGGGNTSLKARAADLFGEEVAVLHIKGSGWDLAHIEPAGLPAVALARLARLRDLEQLADEVMMAELRAALLDPAAPNPSVETLLHAFLPHRFVDHSHADAILALTNQPDGEARCRALYGERIGWVPYVMPGLALAKRAAEIFEKAPEVEALILEKHGLFTFGDDAQTSYERHIAIVARATRHLEDATEGRRPLGARAMVSMREPHEVAPLVRGALAEAVSSDGPLRRFVLEHRSNDDILGFAAGGDRALMLAESPPITPDHVIRTKSSYLLVPQPPYGDMKALGQMLQHAVAEYRERYRAYFARNAEGKKLVALDPTPRVVMLPGIGLFAAGENAQAARIAADIAEHTVRTKIRADTIGAYVGLSEAEIFEMEYWSLEQAKLGKRAPAPLEGQVALITGGAGAIGEGIARTLLAAGAHVVLADLDAERLERIASTLDESRCLAQQTDVTDERSVYEAFLAAAQRFGGVDLVVANAGIAEAGALDVLTLERFDRAIDVNLRGAFITLREALAHFKLQGIGGNIVMLSTKNVFAPGAEFGAYSASKAGAHQLGRIAALEGAAHGVRVNMINADAIFGSADNPSGLWQSVGPARAKARGLDPSQLEDFYRSRNLLKVRVTAEHVGRAVLFFATQQTPTTGAVLPVDGGLPEAFPR